MTAYDRWKLQSPDYLDGPDEPEPIDPETRSLWDTAPPPMQSDAFGDEDEEWPTLDEWITGGNPDLLHGRL